MSEITYRPLTILRMLVGLQEMLQCDLGINDVCENEQEERRLIAACRLVDNFYITETPDEIRIKPLAVYTEDHGATYAHALGFLVGEVALASIGEPPSNQMFGLFLLKDIYAKYPALYRDWVRETQRPAKKFLQEFLQELSHDEFMNDWTNWT